MLAIRCRFFINGFYQDWGFSLLIPICWEFWSAVGIVCMWPVAQRYPTIWDPVDCSLPGSSVHGIFQARILVGLPFPPPGFCQVFFPAFIERIIWFFFFCLLLWRIHKIGFWMLSQPCIPMINPTWSWCRIPFVYCWSWSVKILLRIFCTCVHDEKYRSVFFFPWNVFFWFWYQCNADLIKQVRKHSFLFSFPEFM